MNLLSWLGDAVSSGGSIASGFRGAGVYIPDPLGRLGQGTWKSPDTLPQAFWRLLAPIGFSDVRPSWVNDRITLLGKVGVSGDNRPGDVAKVEKMLGQTGHLDLGATDGPTGYFGARTEQAVKGFQKDHGLKVDGLLNPGGETIRALGAANAGVPATGKGGGRSDKGNGVKRLSGPVPSRGELMDLMDAGDNAGGPSSDLDQAIGEAVLGLVPGVGEAMGAKDAYDSGKDALAAWDRGDWEEAAKSGGMAALSGLGAIPFAGTLVRGGKGTLKIGGPALKALRKHFPDGKDFEGFAQRVSDRTPLGFARREEVAKVVKGMQNKLRESGFDDVTVTIRGSSATGRKFNKKTGIYDGPGFDEGRKSDFDFALVSPKLFAALKEEGVPVRGGGTRTTIVDEDVLKELGLKNLLPKSLGGKTRKRSVVVFRDQESLVGRGPHVPLD